MAFAPRTHWRVLIGSTALVVAAALIAPRWLPQPDLDEHRGIAEAPNSPRSFADLRAFPVAVDAYVADNFPARPSLIAALNYLRMKVGVSGSDRIVVGRDGWLFYDDGSALSQARNYPAYTDDEARAWLEALAGRSESLAARGVSYLVIVPPAKEVMRPDLGPSWYDGPDINRPAAMLSRLAATSNAGDLLYLHDALERPTRWGLKTYTAPDTHWSGLGAYYGYAALMRRLKTMGVTGDEPRPIEDFTEVRGAEYSRPRDLAQMLGVASYVAIDYPELEDPRQQSALRTKYLSNDTSWMAPRVVDTGADGKPVLLLMMDSYSNALNPFLYGHFSRIVFAHNQDGTWRDDLVERFKPDIVVTEVVERGLPGALTPSPPPSDAAKAQIAAAMLEPHRPRPTLAEQARRFIGGRGDDHLIGTSGRDEFLGKAGDDTLEGRDGGDRMQGGPGDDLMLGGKGADWLSGDRGDDTLTGGEGPDKFHSFAGAGVDRITDFSSAEGDVLELDAGSIYGVAQVGGDTVVTMKRAKVILVGVFAADLGVSWIVRR